MYYNKIASYNLSLKLKEKGYTKNHGYQYDSSGIITDPAAPWGYPGVCEAPSYAEILDWLLTRKIEVDIHTVEGEWEWDVRSYDKPIIEYIKKTYISFALCMEDAIDHALDCL